MCSQKSGRSIFGDMNGSTLWAFDAAADSTTGGPEIPLLPGQVVFLFLDSVEISLESDACGQEQFSGGQIVVVGTGQSIISLKHVGNSDLMIVSLRREILNGMLESFRPGLREELREAISPPAKEIAATLPLSEMVMQRLLPAFRDPPVSGTALSFWFESQIREMIALVCFKPTPETGEFFCSRQKRLAINRVAKVKAILKSRLDEAIDLQRLADEIGCSPFYLSRTFSSTTGMTITKYIRKLRIEAAAELLLSGRFNVSEVAIEVGYQSLSHFSKAFQQVKGCLPSKYDAA